MYVVRRPSDHRNYGKKMMKGPICRHLFLAFPYLCSA